MLARVAELRANGRWRAKGRAGFLVKAPKRGQDLRVDLPAIGPETLAGAAKAFLRGVAVAAGGVLMLDREGLAAQADAAGLFLYGFAESRHEIFHRHRRALGRCARRKASGRAARARPARPNLWESAARPWRAKGFISLFPLSDISVMGILPVLARLPTLLRRINETARAVAAARPDFLVLIDSPGFYPPRRAEGAESACRS